MRAQEKLKKKNLPDRHGTAMIAMFAFIVVGGIIAGKVVPSLSMRLKENNDRVLRHHLAEIRQAFDLKALTDPTFNPDLSSISNINQALKLLETQNFLRSASLTDPLIPQESWENATTSFWVGVTNVPINNSFESNLAPDISKNEIVASWVFGTSDSVIATDTQFFPSQNTGVFDDYEGQNKLGVLFSASGTSLKISR